MIYILSLFFFVLSEELVANNVLTIIGTTNVHGEIDPCGWKKKPLGGLARKATILEQLNKDGINPLILDAGDSPLKICFVPGNSFSSL